MLRRLGIMLPAETLAVIFATLRREDLEAVQLSSSRFTTVLCGKELTRDGPRRTLVLLEVKSNNHYVLSGGPTEGNKNVDLDIGEVLVRYLRFCGLQTLLIGFDRPVAMNKAVFNALLPVKDSWANAVITLVVCFNSAKLLEHCFGELFRGKVLSLEVRGPPLKLTRPFLQLEAVKQCQHVAIHQLPFTLTVSEVVDWVHHAVHVPKELTLNAGIIHGIHDEKTQRLFEDLKKVSKLHIGSRNKALKFRFS